MTSAYSADPKKIIVNSHSLRYGRGIRREGGFRRNTYQGGGGYRSDRYRDKRNYVDLDDPEVREKVGERNLRDVIDYNDL